VREESSIGEGKTKPSTSKTMKLSVETKVAAAVATGFAALTFGAIAQENSGGQNGYSPTNNLGEDPHEPAGIQQFTAWSQ